MTDATWVRVTDDVAAVRLSSDDLLVDVLPANGGDVYSVVDRRTGIDLLWKAPWGTDLPPDEAPTSRDRWLTRTWGGWQVLLPNTGDEASEGGATWGFHGEAGLRSWDVSSAGLDELDLALELETAPFEVRRGYRVRASTLSLETTIRNRATEAVEFLWGEHPTFGEDFAAGATLEIDAESIRIELADSVGVQAGDRLRWPGPESLADRSLDRIPPRSPSRFLFAFLDGLREGTYRLRNDRLGIAARLSWPLEVFPCVWLWEEIAFTQQAPWKGQAYAVGIEPQTAYPALGMSGLRRHGGHGLTLGPGDAMAATLTLSVERADGGG
jgi:galactose mutarotase-like enzyme